MRASEVQWTYSVPPRVASPCERWYCRAASWHAQHAPRARAGYHTRRERLTRPEKLADGTWLKFTDGASSLSSASKPPTDAARCAAVRLKVDSAGARLQLPWWQAEKASAVNHTAAPAAASVLTAVCAV